MSYEVVVVGAGLGGLTAAAVLAARGASVCVVERASQAGGCVAASEKFGYVFEPTAGLYAGWGENETHARLFAELRAAPPGARRLLPAYTVRLADGAQVRVGHEDWGETEAELCAAFPECAALAVGFFDELWRVAEAEEAARARALIAVARRRGEWLRKIVRRGGGAEGVGRNEDEGWIEEARADVVATRLSGTSPRFRRFIDAQLQLFASCSSAECSLLEAARSLAPVRRGLYALAGGAQAHADALAESIRRSGGALRFDTTALRLSYDAAGTVAGVVLLSGEELRASRAVVSNLTVWDTYGKLVGAARTPADVRAGLRRARGRGAYLVLLGLDEEAAARLPSERVIAISSEEGGEFDPASPAFDPARSMCALNVAPAWDARAPGGRRAATLAAFADASEWFAYHEDEAEHEAQDERALAFWWERLHEALPEIGGGCEVVETLTPRTYYEQTRRRLGSVWGLARTREIEADPPGHRTHLRNLYAVGDTAASANGVEAVTRSALAVADEIAPLR
jgi:phytoene dehydrogenase-like protein